MTFGSLGVIWSEIGLDIRKLDAGVMAAQVKLAGADKTITSWGQQLTNQSTKLVAVGGIMAGAMVAAGAASVAMASKFETSMRNVNSISKLSEAQFKKQADEVLTLSTKLPQSAKVLADGLYDIASSGFQGADGMKVLTASAKAASAGLTTTAVSAKGITAVLNAYGLEAKDAAAISDTMFKIVDKGVITFEELSSTVGDWVGMAKAANLSFNEASGAIAYMTTKGISASEAGVSLQRMLTGIIKPTDEMAAVIKNAGFESGEMMLKTLGLTGSMKVLNDATGGSITNLINLIPEIRGVRGANALLGAGYEDLTKFMSDFKDTTGATAVALSEQSKSLEYQMTLLKNNASAVVIALGSELIPTVTKYVKSLTEFIQVHKEGIVELAKFGGGAIAIIGSLLLLAGAIGKVRGAVLLLNTTMLANPYLLAALAIASTLLLTGDSVQKYGDRTEEAQKQIKDFSDTIATSEKTLSKGKNTQDEFTKSTQILFNELTKSPAIFDELNPKIVEINKNFADGAIGPEAARQAIIDLAKEYKSMPADMATYNKYMGETATTTIEAKMATQDHENAVAALASQYPNLTATEVEAQVAAVEIAAAMNEGAGAADNQAQSIDDLRSSFNQLIRAIFGGITTYNDFQEANWAVEAAQKAVAEAEKELEKAQKATGGTYTANNEALQSYLSTNVEYLKNSAKANELQAKINKLVAEGKGETSAYFTAVESLGKVQGKLNEITAEGAKITGTYNSTGQQTEKQMAATAEKTRELEQAQNDLDAANITAIETAFALSTQIGITTKQQEEARKKAIELGLEYVKSGQISEEAFLNMASQFGTSAEDIIEVARIMGIKVDEATIQRIIRVGMDTGQVAAGVRGVWTMIGSLPTFIEIPVYVGRNMNPTPVGRTNQSKTIVPPYYAMGGTVGDIPHAASGMVVPQTGRSYLIQAEQYEDVVNTSQQRNLAEWIMGKANSRPDSNVDTDDRPILVRNIIELEGKVLLDYVSKGLRVTAQDKLTGVGIK